MLYDDTEIRVMGPEDPSSDDWSGNAYGLGWAEADRNDTAAGIDWGDCAD